MAKRKKKQRKKKNSGGGFGKSGSRKGLTAVQRSGDPLRDVLPPKFFFDHLEHKERCDEAEAILADNPDDISARTVLAKQQDEHAERRELLEQIVADGRDQCADLIHNNTDTKGKGLWGEQEARSLMLAMVDLAKARRFNDMPKSTELFLELSELNPLDQLGIRHHLLYNYLAQVEHDKAEALIEKYRIEETADFLFGQALLDFQRATRESTKDSSWKVDPDRKRPFETAPGEAFETARRSLKKAVGKYPWSVQFNIDCRTFAAGEPPAWQPGTPTEALAYAKRAQLIWSNMLTSLWLVSEGLAAFEESDDAIEAIDKHSHEYLSIQAGIRLYDRNDFLIDDGSEFSEEMKAISDICETVEEVLVTVSTNR